MGKVLFKCKYFSVKVRDIAIVLIVVLLLFFGFQSCQKKDEEIKKDTKITNVCALTSQNLKDVNRLLKRADLCSDGWFKDLESYIKRIEEQNSHLKKKKEKKYKVVYQQQARLLKQLNAIKKEQTTTNIETLEKSIKDYSKFTAGECKGERKK